MKRLPLNLLALVLVWLFVVGQTAWSAVSVEVEHEPAFVDAGTLSPDLGLTHNEPLPEAPGSSGSGAGLVHGWVVGEPPKVLGVWLPTPELELWFVMRKERLLFAPSHSPPQVS